MDELIKQNGAVNDTVTYLGKSDGAWLGVPATVGSQIKGPCLAHRFAQATCRHRHPGALSGRAAAKAESWNLDVFLKAAEACHKAGVPFGIGLGTTADSVDSAGAFFHAHGAALVDAKGNITVNSDPVRQSLEFYKKLASFMRRISGLDDASNNKWLVSGRGALIMNPPSAWAVAKRDAPQIAEQLWTHGFPAGPKGRYAPFIPYFWASGTSRRTFRRPRVCWCIFRRAPRRENGGGEWRL